MPGASMLFPVDRDEYQRRIAELRPLLRVFRNGRLSVHGSGGASGMLFIETPAREEFYIGGAHTAEAHAIAAAVNLVLDLCDRERGHEDRADKRPRRGSR